MQENNVTRSNTMSKYEVQEWMLSGWENTWSDENGNPTVFDSEKDAHEELAWFLRDCVEAVREGEMEDVPDIESFRVVKMEIH